MFMQLQTGMADFICPDMPPAKGAAAKDDNLVVLDFSGTDGDFQFETEAQRAENVNIGISVKKGNTQLKDTMDAVLSQLTAEDFDAIMDPAIAAQPATAATAPTRSSRRPAGIGLSLTGEHYHNSASTASSDFVLLDAALSYKWKRFRWELTCSNLLDTREYVYSVLSAASSFSTDYLIRPRSYLLKMFVTF